MLLQWLPPSSWSKQALAAGMVSPAQPAGFWDMFSRDKQHLQASSSPSWIITGYSMSQHRYVPFPSLFLLLNLALFFLPLSTRLNMKTLCSRLDKASASVWSRRQAAWREERTNHIPDLSHSSPTPPPKTMTTSPAAALADSSDTWGRLTSKGRTGGGTVASVCVPE